MTIIKRTGEKATYDENKIYNALYKAFEETDGSVSAEDEEIIKNIVKEITNDFVEDGTVNNVEGIQDIVEDKLMESKRKDVARAYIRYRYSHQKEREKEAKIVRTWLVSNASNFGARLNNKDLGSYKKLSVFIYNYLNDK